MSGLCIWLIFFFSLDGFLSYLSDVLRQISLSPWRLTTLRVRGTKSMVPLLLFVLITNYYFIILTLFATPKPKIVEPVNDIKRSEYFEIMHIIHSFLLKLLSQFSVSSLHFFHSLFLLLSFLQLALL
jgi:hypothetical protein